MTMLWILALTAQASEECEALCTRLDAAEEVCEAAYGDGGFCESIGTLEATCDPEDGGTTDACPDLCERIDALDDRCDEVYGEADAVCQELDAIAEDCEDEEDEEEEEDDEDEDDEEDDEEAAADASGEGRATGSGLSCATRTGAATFAGLSLGLIALATRRRR